MKSFVVFALAATALARPSAQSDTSGGCQSSSDGTFSISVVQVTPTSKRSVEKRQLNGILKLTLKDGILTDQAGRTGSVVANHQFQFDNPVQDNALKTSGFSVCSNGSLALDGSAIWYQCLSGDFHNLYDQSQGGQCSPIYLVSTGGGGAVSQVPDGQPIATQISDGQPQAPTAPVVSQISDGQPQAPTAVPHGPLVSQISDGQPQAPTAMPHGPLVSQISDGQPQAPTAMPHGPLVSQISDGQPQAPTAMPHGPLVSQISDGQPQAPTGAPAYSGPLVSQISDGQPQVPQPTGTPSGNPVSQISDGQPQAGVTSSGPTSPNATSPPAPQFTGAAVKSMAGISPFVAGLLALGAML